MSPAIGWKWWINFNCMRRTAPCKFVFIDRLIPPTALMSIIYWRVNWTTRSPTADHNPFASFRLRRLEITREKTPLKLRPYCAIQIRLLLLLLLLVVVVVVFWLRYSIPRKWKKIRYAIQKVQISSWNEPYSSFSYYYYYYYTNDTSWLVKQLNVYYTVCMHIT